MDGQFHAIEFDPSATADEVLKLVKSKIGLRENAQGNNLQFKMEVVFTEIYFVSHIMLRRLIVPTPHFRLCCIRSTWNSRTKSPGG